MFQGVNTNKRSLTLDMTTDAGRDLAMRLVAHSDVLVENYSPRVLDGWGLSYAAVKKRRQDILMMRLPAFGLSGPWRDRTGYAQTQEQISGLAWMTGSRARSLRCPTGPAIRSQASMRPSLSC